jgi:protocatechuate 3,4-dioxygenase beta subunit
MKWNRCLLSLTLAPLLAGCESVAPSPESGAEAAASAEERWVVSGRITDEEGQGLAGVEVLAHCGAGTLLVTGRGRSDAQGRYTLHFQPGMRIFRDEEGAWETSLQAATISPLLAGYSERNLHRQGDLRMAHRAPEADSARGVDPEEVVILGREHRVDFVMVPAATIRGMVIDEKGEPRAGVKLWIVGEELPPSFSVLASIVTDDEGRFEHAGVPPRYFWRLASKPVRPDSKEQTKAWVLSRAGCFELDLEWRSDDSGQGSVLRISRGPQSCAGRERLPRK